MIIRSIRRQRTAASDGAPPALAAAHALDARASSRVLLTVLLVLAMIATGLAGTAGASGHCTATVDPGEDIQAAISAATTGNVICLAAGVHNLGSTLNFEKNDITIEGAGEGATTLNASGVTGYGVLWTADNVELRDLTVQGPAADAANRYGLKIQAPNGAATAVSGVTITNVTVQGSGRSEIDLNFAENVFITDATLDGYAGAVASKGVGIGMISATNVHLTRVTTMGNAWGAVGVYTDSSTHFPDDASPGNGLTITDLNAEEANVLYGEGENGGAIAGLVAPQFTHTVRNPDHRDTGGDFTFYQTSEAAATGFAAAISNPLSSTVRAADGAYVVADGLSVQAAIDAAGIDGTVLVSPGDYDEDVSIAAAGLTLQGVGPTSILGLGASSIGIAVAADRVTLKDLAVDKSTDAGARVGYGVRATADLEDLELAGVTITGANSGLHVPSDIDIDGLQIDGSHFDDNIFGWYFDATVPSDVTNVTVTDSTFDGNLRKGLYVEKLSSALFDGITVNGSGVDPTYLVNNGIDINLKRGAYENIEIRNSQIIDSGTAGTGEPFPPAAVTIKARDDGAYAALPATLSGVTLERVTISGGVVGVRFGEGGTPETAPSNAGPSNVRVLHSTISGTSGIAIENRTSAQVDARNNWWGSASNPAAQLSGDVRVAPWCVNAQCTTPPVSTPTPTPPVGGDTPPPAPPKVTPPKPATPPTPIAVPPGQTVEVPRGGTTGFVGGQPAPVTKVVVAPPPPPAQRTPEQVQQVQQTANQIVSNLQNTLPTTSTTPRAVTVTQTDSGAEVNGLLSSPAGQNKPVPAENVVSVNAGGTTVLATGADGEGNSLPLEDDGTINTPQGGSLGTAVGGLTPGSPGQIVAFSDPQVLGTFTADEDGLFRGEVSVPHWLEPGDHTLVFNGQGAQGEITLAMSITVAASDVFSDVVADSTHGLAISRLKALAISQGYSDGTFRPGESITRAQMAAFLARGLGLDTDATSELSDVTGAHAGAIAAILDADVAAGYADGTFRPAAEVTRGQMASFLANAAGLEPVAESSLLDAAGAHAGAINAVYVSGLANGQTDGMFRPGEPVNRAQMATFVVNLVDHLAEEQAAS